ncbi:putative lipid II flippase FtsW [Cerasicoccus arenae]|uniref:Probable peptidoglycan glycosyltransferase FtsW n=1 Tax=Cerasicoccus arenae TaxID=424488 RepID=A0A8J3DKQ2_9BACT|nr:putative lipid II flippase FtsW [Cerasicoccus arenae]MBK1856854.1 putative lipid II flippase FtsW [Cerasicoccus arenae]GHC11298.1 putative lipid II flippase FtsW [Cerasicoccus arenae]
MTHVGQQTIRYLRRPGAGWALLACVTVLTALGLIMLTSAGQSHNKIIDQDAYYLFRRQAIWLGIALASGLVAALVSLDWLGKCSHFIAAGVLVLLGLVVVPQIGVEVNGARRWLDLGPMRLQVSDLAKIAMIIWMAHYYGTRQRQVTNLITGFLVPCMAIGLTCGLIFLQPDFGTAALCGGVGFAMMFLAGARLWYLVPSAVIGVVGFSVAVYLDPVRLRRITSFLDVEANKADSGYQLWQGILAFGAGGVPGVGLGQGRQQLFFLPEAHTDFIFPVIGEELGLLATSAVVCLFAAIFTIGVLALRRAPNLYQFLLATGALLFLTMQALINMGVVTGLLPTKGMSLPFISYGGTNLVTMFVLIGLLFNCLASWSASPLLKPREL